MSGEQGTDPRPDADWSRRKRLAEVFGDVLPDTTGDERDEAGPSVTREAASDRWLEEQVPPHHG